MLRRSRHVLIFFIHIIHRYVGGVQQSVHVEYCTCVYNKQYRPASKKRVSKKIRLKLLKN